MTHVLAAIFVLIAMIFVWRSFYRMRITADMSVSPAVPELQGGRSGDI
jgi:hypothetical protein